MGNFTVAETVQVSFNTVEHMVSVKFILMHSFVTSTSIQKQNTLKQEILTFQ